MASSIGTGGIGPGRGRRKPRLTGQRVAQGVRPATRVEPTGLQTHSAPGMARYRKQFGGSVQKRPGETEAAYKFRQALLLQRQSEARRYYYEANPGARKAIFGKNVGKLGDLRGKLVKNVETRKKLTGLARALQAQLANSTDKDMKSAIQKRLQTITANQEKNKQIFSTAKEEQKKFLTIRDQGLKQLYKRGYTSRQAQERARRRAARKKFMSAARIQTK